MPNFFDLGLSGQSALPSLPSAPNSKAPFGDLQSLALRVAMSKGQEAGGAEQMLLAKLLGVG